MESSLHTANRTKTFKESYRLLKPGGRLVALEYVTLPAWNQNNEEMKELMIKHLHGNGAAITPNIDQCLKMIKDAGFEIKEHYDHMEYGKYL